MSTIPLPSFDPKEGINYIKDPIHSYIYITRPSRILDAADDTTELQIISSPWVQRLRRIRQTQAAYTVYPGLEHSRFEHVLGVMHLAGRMARKWYGQLLRRLREVKGHDDLLATIPDLAYVEEVFRLAGLLHDVGHGPFSHSLDSAYRTVFKDDTITHELISCLIIENELADEIRQLRRSPNGTFTDAIDPRLVSWLIRPRSGEYTDREYFWLRALRPIISGVFDADALDYISRDSYHGGLLEYGSLDIDRFLEYAFLSLDGERGGVHLCLHKGSLPALQFLFLSRFKMYEACYFHKAVRAFEHRAEELLGRLLKKLDFADPRSDVSSFLSKFIRFDEYWLFGQADRWKASDDPELIELGVAWDKFARREHGLELIHEHRIMTRDRLTTYLVDRGTGVIRRYQERLSNLVAEWSKASNSELASMSFDQSAIRIIKEEGASVCETVIFDAPFLDVRKGVNPLNINDKVRLYDPLAPESLDEVSLKEIVSDLPRLFAPVRMYVGRQDVAPIVQQALRRVASEMNEGEMLQDTNF